MHFSVSHRVRYAVEHVSAQRRACAIVRGGVILFIAWFHRALFASFCLPGVSSVAPRFPTRISFCRVHANPSGGRITCVFSNLRLRASLYGRVPQGTTPGRMLFRSLHTLLGDSPLD